jgi:hypothetical protein
MKEYAIGIGLGLTLFGMVWAPTAHADGFDPDLIANELKICAAMDQVTEVIDVKNLFEEYGAQYVADRVHNGCSRHDLKVYAALMSMQEDDPGWDCATMGNRRCGTLT